MDLIEKFDSLSLREPQCICPVSPNPTLYGADCIIENSPLEVSVGTFILLVTGTDIKIPFRVRSLRLTSTKTCAILISEASYGLLGHLSEACVKILPKIPITVPDRVRVAPSVSEKDVIDHGLLLRDSFGISDQSAEKLELFCIQPSTIISRLPDACSPAPIQFSRLWLCNVRRLADTSSYICGSSTVAVRTAEYIDMVFGHLRFETTIEENIHKGQIVVIDECSSVQRSEYMRLRDKYGFVTINTEERLDVSSQKPSRGLSSEAWGEIAGYSNIIADIRHHVESILSKNELSAEIGIRPPRGILLYGPPGCSKTMIAKAVAKDLGTGFLSVKGPEIYSKYVGDSEKALGAIFHKARNQSPCVIFFDEFDAIGVSRGSSSSAESRVIAQLLTEMDGLGKQSSIIVIAATNRPDIIDAALLRPGRFDLHFHIPLPDYRSREEILAKTLVKHKVSVESSLVGEFAGLTEGLSGAAIVSLCKFLAVEDIHGRPASVESVENYLHSQIKHRA